VKPLLLATILLAGTPAWAQRNEVTLLAGYTTSGDIENKAPTVQDLQIEGGFTWGVQAGHFFSPHLGLEASWRRSESALSLRTTSDLAELFDLNADQVLLSAAYRFGGAESALRPFLLAGLGATFFSATDLESETKLAWALGAGVKWSPSKRFGARLEARYNPTYLDDTGEDFCDPFGFCQAWLHRLELTGGLVIAF
jgi:opacity protein-like surface antigen